MSFSKSLRDLSGDNLDSHDLGDINSCWLGGGEGGGGVGSCLENVSKWGGGGGGGGGRWGYTGSGTQSALVDECIVPGGWSSSGNIFFF